MLSLLLEYLVISRSPTIYCVQWEVMLLSGETERNGVSRDNCFLVRLCQLMFRILHRSRDLLGYQGRRSAYSVSRFLYWKTYART